MARITVLAGTNGAGKSSIAGQALREAGGAYFNPDEATRQILAANPGLAEEAANAFAWQESVQRLRAAITHNADYTFETTLGGQTVTGLLLVAAAAGHELVIWYCGLDSPERHLARVAARVADGGHDIPEAKVRTRYEASRANLVRLMPHVTMLRVYDNSAEADPATGQRPAPELVLEIKGGTLVYPRNTEELATTPAWAKPLVACAFQW
ncbi:AAA family ATPase [Metallibacterium sp.]